MNQAPVCLPSAADNLRSHAGKLAQTLGWAPNVRSSLVLANRWRLLSRDLDPLLRRLTSLSGSTAVSDDLRWLHDNANLLMSELQNTGASLRPLSQVPHVQTSSGSVVPRALAVAEGFFAATEFGFTEDCFAAYVTSFQEHTDLHLSELWTIVPAIKLILLEQIATRAARTLQGVTAPQGVGLLVRSLREIVQTSWSEVIGPLVPFDNVLQQDPAGAYCQMDDQSRDFYRSEVVNIAEHSDFSERQVAQAALQLSQEAAKRNCDDAREAKRYSHIGYYLAADGSRLLHEKVGFRPSLGQRIRSFLTRHPDELYLPAIEAMTFVIMSVVVLVMTNPETSPALILFAMLAVLLPSSQSAVQVANYLITSLLPPRILPKLDFADGIPSDYVTMVAVPTLLLNENQVHKLVDDLEVRFLGNRDRNLHFALLSDLPDALTAPREDNPLVNLCAALIEQLNERYAAQKTGSFFLFHRHRVYNARDRLWMGWERKRGKLLEFNRLLGGQHDGFPVKIGNLSMLPQVRFVITLDADTELPRGSAHRLIGTLAHPLNQAIIDHENNIVVAGYGILQPRVGVSIRSSARSRLAKIYSGQTGFDIYTRAVSDVYQDLYQEGTFAGKGIYDVAVLRQVLDGRFPHNALLSHDLLEGAYARAGLVTDIAIIEDYPSHYSAYNRRKHRWLRGDWQVAEWLRSTVPGESGHRVPNPISTVSKWKILDNLRRSLAEPSTFLLLMLGWLVMPGSPVAWTLATIAILFIPAWCRALFELTRATIERKSVIAREAMAGLLVANVNVFLTLTFLAHQTLLSLDAMIRALVRRTVTRRHLLEWETAAEAENGESKRTHLDTYLNWTPAVAVLIGLVLFFVRRQALPAALPILFLWACSKPMSVWLNLPPRAPHPHPEEKDRFFLREIALRTWRYFAEFSTEEHHWLIPDNVQEYPFRVAARVSPTNLGLLLNVRQAACKFGYITVPEFAEITQRTLATVAGLQRYRGHLFNWYDTQTLQPLPPLFVSSVDSGNLLASLWTLAQGCLDQLTQPLLQPSLAEGLTDCIRLLRQQRVISRKNSSALQQGLAGHGWLPYLLDVPESIFERRRLPRRASRAAEAHWLIAETQMRLNQNKALVRTYTPWLLPEFSALRDDPVIRSLSDLDELVLGQLPGIIDRLMDHLRCELQSNQASDSLSQRLLDLLPDARRNAISLVQLLRGIASEANRLADEMKFGFLLNRQRKLLAVGFEVETEQITSSCYDLLASEARIAVFVAIAKDDIPQEAWFVLGRPHTVQAGKPMLLSWTGTMFEYLMPSIWMRTYPDTLLARTQVAACRVQSAYGAAKAVPWGISESAHAEKDESGNYGYFAFGIPALALAKNETSKLVISPYSTFLALHADPPSALRNLRRMAGRGWYGQFGFYDAADFTRRSWLRDSEVVRCWMAHHQGMTLLSIANLLHGGVVQRWFHRDPRVQATELLLQEKPLAYVRSPHERYGTTAA